MSQEVGCGHFSHIPPQLPEPSFVLTALLKIFRNAPNQIPLSLPRSGRPLEQPRLQVDFHIADGIVGMVVEDLVPFHVLPVPPTPVIKMHHITRNAGQRSSHLVETFGCRVRKCSSQAVPYCRLWGSLSRPSQAESITESPSSSNRVRRNLVGPNIKCLQRVGSEGRCECHVGRISARAISTRPMRGVLLRALKIYHCPPTYASNQALKSMFAVAGGTPMSPR